jgi:hypothetical protein
MIQLQNCDPRERPALLAKLRKQSDAPTPAKVLTAAEENMVAELRAEIDQLVKDDSWGNGAVIQANARAIRRIQGQA